MAELINKRGQIKGKLTRIHRYFQDIKQEDAVLEQVEERRVRLKEIFESFDEVQDQIELQASDRDLDLQVQEREEFESKYFESMSIASYLIKQLNKPNLVMSTPVTPSPSSNQVDDLNVAVQTLIEHQTTLAHLIKDGSSHDLRNISLLPKLDVPTFNGNYSEWPEFFDTFKKLIHENTKYSEAMKLQYLKRCLVGDARDIFKNLPSTDANYSQAYAELVETYNRSDLIINSYFESIFDQKKLNTASVGGLRTLSNNVCESVRALTALGLPTDHWDAILIYILSSRLDNETLVLWRREQVKGNSSIEGVKFLDLVNFIRNRIYELSSFDSKLNSQKSVKQTNNHSNNRFSHTTTSSNMISDCVICSGDHGLHKCPKFLEISISSRRKLVKDKGLCFNCLRSSHVSKNCPSKTNCRKCNTRHHTLVHDDGVSGSTMVNNSITNRVSTSTIATPSPVNVQTASSFTITQAKFVTLLPTAVILIKDQMNQFVPCRILLDSGSQISLISQNCIQKLKIKPEFERRSIQGINSPAPAYSKGSVSLILRSRFSNYEIETRASILPKLTSLLPSSTVQQINSSLFDRIELADPYYYKPSKIDVIVGADVFFQIICGEKICNDACQPMAIRTQFGWIISGNAQAEHSVVHHTFHTCIDVDNTLKRFWELEDIPEQILLTEEEQSAELHFLQTHSRNQDGRYITRLPFRISNTSLGNSKHAARQRLFTLEKRFRYDSNLKSQYSKFLQEYQQLGHMVKVSGSKENLPENKCFYLPHHAVIKDSSSTTRLRVVFDGSRKSSSGISLNDLLMVGSISQRDIWSLLLGFRIYRFAYTADIAKMYRQILVHSEDTQYQRILWRENDTEPIQEFELVTVTYGTASAPHSATRVLLQLAKDEENKFPVGAQSLRQNFYVDDFIGGSHTLEEALQVKDELTGLLCEGGFDLRRWCSNTKEFLCTVDQDHRETSCILPGETEIAIKTLGMKWIPESDHFTFDVHLDLQTSFSKRKILSEISRVFDPLGLVGPCTTLAKLFMQRIWISGVNWDEQLPDGIVAEYTHFRKSIIELSKLQLPRWVSVSKESEIQLIGFADASEKAYSAVVYIRVVQENKIYVQLLASKSKLAPIRQVSLPRLELCAAHLLTKLISKIKSTLKVPDGQIIVYTDSTVVLAWLQDIPRRWKTFIGNRTSHILSSIPFRHWFHVRSSDNPADASSRGLTSQQLLDHPLWWSGPSFLSSSIYNIHNLSKTHFITELESRSLVHTVHECTSDLIEFDLFQRYSTLNRIQRITSWCYRFINNCRLGIQQRTLNRNSALLVKELQFGLEILIKFSQQATFSRDISQIRNSKNLSFKSKLRSLNPFIDKNGVLRVGGRIQHGNFSFGKTHPIILSGNHMFSKLIVEDIHRRYFHSGQQLTLSILHSKYWVIGAKYLVKRCIHLCVTCIRYRADTSTQLMGSLPSFRVTPARPFTNTGVDFAGPFYVRAWKGKGAKILKAYVSIFVCMITRAIHIELVSDLSSKAFLAALHRFTSRRGACENIYCDNGRNFVGAARELAEIRNLINSNCTEIASKLSGEQIQFHFIPVATPHFGGMWESSVKSLKTHFKRVVGEQRLTYEEMVTLLCQIEACLNSRPISAQSYDADDLEILTPGHFLTLGPLKLPQQEPLDIVVPNLTRWQFVQSMCQQFWKRWSMEYVSSLQKRKKWQYRNKNLQVNDLVLVKEERVPPGQWLMGRILATKPGKDSAVRVVTLKTRFGIIERAVQKLCVLLPDEQQQQST